MKILLMALALLTSQNLFAQKENLNLDFEEVINNKAKKWHMPNQGDFMLSIDSVIKYRGKHALLIQNIAGESQSTYGMAGYNLLAKFKGDKIEIKFRLKLENVADHIDFICWIRDEDRDRLQHADLLNNRIYGNRDWEEYSLKLPLDSQAVYIYFAPVLYGNGKLWVDDIQILIDGKDISEANLKTNFNANPPIPINYGNNPSAGAKIKVKNAEIYYETYGNGKPLILLHGNSQSIMYLKKQIKEFAKTYKVIAVDTRGQGKSIDTNSYPLTYDLFAEDMKTLMDTLKIKNANVYGWSDGGNTALIMANKYPTYVNKIAVTGAVMYPTTQAVSKNVLTEIQKAIKAINQKTDASSKQQVRLFDMLLKEPQITDDDLNKIQAKALIMAGEKDMVLQSHTEHITSQIKDAKIYIFKGATHYAPVEIPEQFNKVVLDFFE